MSYIYETLPGGMVQKWYANVKIGVPMTLAEAEVAKAEDRHAAEQAEAGRVSRFGHSQIAPAHKNAR